MERIGTVLPRDFYARVLGPARLDRMVDIRRHE